jgi:SAM-dependent methyltransferase
MKQKEELKNRLESAWNSDFSGWDFTYLINRGEMKESPLPWSYEKLVIDAASKSEAILDLGTGGGEFLHNLIQFGSFPKTIAATEGYEPNIPLAKKRLEPLGITVKEIKEDLAIPFDDQSFDLVINRHEEFDPSEIKRVLKADGKFITQQVGGMNDSNLNAALGAKQAEHFDWGVIRACESLKSAGLEITKSQDHFGINRFYSLEALVFYIKCIPWQIPDFSLDRYLVKLKSLDDQIGKQGYIDLIKHRFLLIAEKQD